MNDYFDAKSFVEKQRKHNKKTQSPVKVSGILFGILLRFIKKSCDVYCRIDNWAYTQTEKRCFLRWFFHPSQEIILSAGAIILTLQAGALFSLMFYVEYMRPGGEVYEIARVVEGEAGIDTYGGKILVVSSIFNRVKADGFPNTILGVIQKTRIRKDTSVGCDYDSYCDDKEEVVTDEVMQLATVSWIQYKLGIYVDRTNGAHSFCRNQACISNWAYFGQFEEKETESKYHRAFGESQTGA